MPGIVPPACVSHGRIIECISESQVRRIPATPTEAASPFNNLAAHGPGIAQYCTLSSYCHGNAGRRPLTRRGTSGLQMGAAATHRPHRVRLTRSHRRAQYSDAATGPSQTVVPGPGRARRLGTRNPSHAARPPRSVLLLQY